jgi:plasmid stability protein
MSNDQEQNQQPTMTVVIPADIHEAFAKIAAADGRSIEAIVAAVLGADLIRRAGGTSDQVVIEYNRRMGFTREEMIAQALQVQDEVRAEVHTEIEAAEAAQRTEKGDFDA